MKKLIVTLSIVGLLFVNSGFGAIAFAAVDRPDSPDAPSTADTTDTTDQESEEDDTEEETVSSPDKADSPDRPDNAGDEEETEDQVQVEEVEEEPQENSTEEVKSAEDTQEEEEHVVVDEDDDGDLDAPQVKDADPETTGGSTEDGKVGDSTIETGDANGSGSINNTGNTNISESDQQESGLGGVEVSNVGNGSDSENSGVVSSEEDSTTIQDNNADLDSSLEVQTSSGDNSASKNVGDSSIDTGDANATGTITNFANTNIEGALVSEFNVVDDQVGDLVLDYEANCVSGCGSAGDISLKNDSNRSGSDNDAQVELVEDSLTFQNNDASVDNELILSADSGNNTADNNTGGDSSIETGDANVVGNVLNFLNNNIAGNVVYGVVNIFGDMTGDIIIPEKYFAENGSEGSSIALDNTKNGADSDNTAEVELVGSEQFVQLNNADIINNLMIDAETGNNKTRDNTGGDNRIETGDVDVDASVLNIANTNVIGEDWWIVFVNNAGEWVGQIFAPDGSFVGGYFASAPGSTANVNDNGDVTITNEGNGSDSENSGEVKVAENNTTIQNNDAAINNNIKLTANTGGNSASRNTGGSSSIETGDANVQLNLVNFVNNNFANANVFLTVVNVFGNWMGDLVAPGGQKPVAQNNHEAGEKHIGGTASTPNNSNSDNHASASNNDSAASSGDSGEVVTDDHDEVAVVLAASNTSGGSNAIAGGKLASGASDQEELAFAGTPKVAQSSEPSSKTRINLAWGIFGIPIYLIFRLVRRRFIGA